MAVLDCEQLVQVRRLLVLQSIISEGDDLVLYALLTLSQCKDLKTGVIWSDFGIRQTVRAM